MKKTTDFIRNLSFYGASDEARTRYLHLGKVALYQMSYTRNSELYYSIIPGAVNPFFKKVQKIHTRLSVGQPGVRLAQ